MRVVFIGDISGKPGRKVIKDQIPEIKTKYKPDIIIANCENAAHGLGVTRAVLNELVSYGVDFFTSGDHVWSVRDFVEDMYDLNLPLVRPYNYEFQAKLPGKGFHTIDLGSKGKLIVINLIGQSFMRNIPRNPFWVIDELFAELELDANGQNSEGQKQNILVDFHAETTAEKLCLAAYLQKRISVFVGTHTHVATADARIIGDMAYVTDVGMTGPLDASLWIKFDNAIHNFKYPFKKLPEIEENGRMVLNAVLIELDNGIATKVQRIDRVLGEKTPS